MEEHLQSCHSNGSSQPVITEHWRHIQVLKLLIRPPYLTAISDQANGGHTKKYSKSTYTSAKWDSRQTQTVVNMMLSPPASNHHFCFNTVVITWGKLYSIILIKQARGTLKGCGTYSRNIHLWANKRLYMRLSRLGVGVRRVSVRCRFR